MRSDPAQEVAIITGASRGIGQEIAVKFAAANVTVVLAARSQDSLEEIAATIRTQGGVALSVVTDVTQADEVKQLVSTTLKKFGRVDVLVNNAAANYVSSLVRSKDERWKEIFEVNVFGAYLCTKAVLPHMIRAKSGRIINIASVAGKVGVAHNSAYSASKAGLIGFTKAIALEVAKIGITVNAICPWHVATEMLYEAMKARGALFGKTAEEYTAQIVAENPQKRLTTVEEIAALALFLASPEARSINGQALNQCGGAVTAS